MIFENTYLGYYLIAWIVVFIIYYIKNRTMGLGGLLIITYTISAFASSMFFSSLNAVTYDVIDINWEPLVYLFLCLNICMLPIYIHSKELGKLKLFTTKRGETFIILCVQLLSPIIIEAFIEILYIAYSTSSDSLGSIYESDADVTGSQLSFIGRKTMAVCRNFAYIWPILFFYLFGKGQAYRKYAIVALLAFSTSILEAYAGASRVGIVRSLMYFFIVFLLFKSSFSDSQKKILIRFFTISGIVLIFALAAITISRFGRDKGNLDIYAWVTLYLGEGPIRFSQHMWELKTTMQGDNTFSLLKELLGLDPITDLEKRREYWGGKLGIPNHIFYTWIGDIYFDLGKVGTLLYAILFSFALELFIRSLLRKGIYSLGSILILALFLLTLEFGITYMTFKVYIVQVLLIYNFLFILLYNYFSKKLSFTHE